MKTCYTNEFGRLDDECVDVISAVCSQWSLDSWNGSNVQTSPISSSKFRDLTFSKDTNYYCVAGTSGTYDMGCYVCKSDKNIMHWAANGNSDSNCSAGYTKTSTPQKDCNSIIPESCYVCKNDSNVLKWDNNGDSDSKCSSGYNQIDKPLSECKATPPSSPTPSTPPENPETGSGLLFIVYIIGFGALAYSIYYFKSFATNKNS